MDSEYNRVKFDALSSKIDSWERCGWKDGMAQGSKFKTVLGMIPFRRVKTHLDAGCGDGEFMKQLYLFYPVIDSIGVDASPNMAKIARRINPSKTIWSGPLEKTPFRDGWFDCITSIGVIQCVKDHMPMLVEFERILNTPGQLLIIGLDIRSVDPEKKPEGYDLYDKNPKEIEKDLESLGLEIIESGGILSNGERTGAVTRDFYVYARK